MALLVIELIQEEQLPYQKKLQPFFQPDILLCILIDTEDYFSI